MPAILLVDQHGVYRRGIRALIESAELAKVVDRASLQNEFCGMFDLLLIDFNCFDRQSRDLLELIRSRNPRMRAAVMSMSNARIDVLSCLSAGFHGYLHKNQPEAELVGAITDLLSGRIYVPPSVIEQNHDDPISGGSLEPESLSLTRRQREVIPLLARGMSTKEIARELNIAVGTAKIHTTALLHALGARNRTEAAFIAAKALQSQVPKTESAALKWPARIRGGTRASMARHPEAPMTEPEEVTATRVESWGMQVVGRAITRDASVRSKRRAGGPP